MIAESTSPRRILLATDLSCRSDRALDRAFALAEQWAAELIAVTVAETTATDMLDERPRKWRRQADTTERMRWRLARDVGGKATNIRMIVAEGEAASAISAIAQREQCDLIVTGFGHDATLGRIFLGSTVDRLVRETRIPILVVRERTAGAYARVLATTDASEESLEALRVASALFPAAALTLFHAFDYPYSSLIDDRDFSHETGLKEAELNQLLQSGTFQRDPLKQAVKTVARFGSPEALLPDYVEDHCIDLTVVGSNGHGALFDALVGSTHRKLLDTLEGDMLIVRES
ncbi:universal stress protein [Sphingopyxis bauzanensis]|uniref:Universal stress protein n=1 Tax=Sphingopyxis bauzanensis TaxID=651663 RepID=A0A246JW79_9SPHN|nr:universal stress protein [Sphingopyxis bauzanensis]MDP3783429.1 universal stress protein [Sphingopyxis sp.]OWQ97319.1 universal stress protein [Sphingopyxis bauzanensis]GGJ49251.1 universal stress protein [Sphingopyxis bauzanensis]